MLRRHLPPTLEPRMPRPAAPVARLPALAVMITLAGSARADLPVVIAHRGASGYLPEHTLEAKAYAHAVGADFLEQDVVLTRDDVPIVLHDTWLERVTDVAGVFPGRQRGDGHFYAIDFSLEEIRRLTVRERRSGEGGLRWPGRFDVAGVPFRIPTLAEEIAFIRGLNRTTGREAGIYTEIKEPAWHRAHDKDPSRVVLEVLRRAGYAERDDPVFLQCFDAAELRRVREELGSRLRLVLLLGDEEWLRSPRRDMRLADVAEYADAIGVWVPSLFAPAEQGAAPQSSGLVEAAHAQGLLVHAYTYRDDELPEGIRGAAEAHALLYRVAGVDGLFSDHPDVSLRHRPPPGLAAEPAVQ